MGEAQVVAAGWHRRERGGLKVTTKQAAELLGITPQGVRMLALRGRLRRYGSGRPGWYDLAEVRELYAATRVTVVAQQVSGV